MNKRPDITARTRKKLIDAFWQLYDEKNINDIRINEITTLAGYHRGTFYEYFTDIYDLLSQEEQAIVDDITRAQGDQKTQDISRAQDDQVATGGQDADLPLMPGIISLYQNNGQRISLLIKNGNTSFLSKLKQALYPLFLEANHVLDDNRTAIIYEFGINGILMSFDYWYRHKDDIPLDEFLISLKVAIENGTLPALRANAR